MVDSIIYPKAILNMFKDDKVKGSVILTTRDNWFNKSNHSNQHRWEQNLNNLILSNKDFYSFKNNVVRMSKVVTSQPYFIEK
jgi:hypothetical protein